MASKKRRIAVIGGGASGLVAAIAAARRLQEANSSAQVLLLERGPRVGKKLLVTGNGRCNLSNRTLSPSAYFGDQAFIAAVLAQFGVSETLSFFESIGLLCRYDDAGRYYPYAETATGVLNMLRLELERLHIKAQENFYVDAIKSAAGDYQISGSYPITADAVILTSGGNAMPKSGSDGSGLSLLSKLGHAVTPTAPALAPIRLRGNIHKQAKGVRVKCRLTVGETSEAGEVQLTDAGLSGIVAMNLSRHVQNGTPVRIDFLPDHSQKQVSSLLERKIQQYPNAELPNLLDGILHKRIGELILKHLHLTPMSRTLAELSARDLKQIAAAAKALPFEAEGTGSYDAAQVTAGGGVTDDFRMKTLESKLRPGLFAAGELLDVDGPCGGYNLQWAWSSGFVAGTGAANYIETMENAN